MISSFLKAYQALFWKERLPWNLLHNWASSGRRFFLAFLYFPFIILEGGIISIFWLFNNFLRLQCRFLKPQCCPKYALSGITVVALVLWHYFFGCWHLVDNRSLFCNCIALLMFFYCYFLIVRFGNTCLFFCATISHFDSVSVNCPVEFVRYKEE